MSSKAKSLSIEEPEFEQAVTNEKPSWDHVEETPKGEPAPRAPYWDSQNVVGAKRNMSPDGLLPAKDNVPPRAGFFKRRYQHVKRHWIIYTIVLVILLAILLPVFFLKIFPAIAQRLVDDAALPIYAASIMNPTPSSVVYSLSSSLKIPAGVTVDLKPITLSLFTNTSGPANPYIRVDMPEYHLSGETAINITNQTATILDQAQFQSFLSDAVVSKQFTLSAAGSTVAYLGALKAPITLNKKVDLAGLNKLEGFSFASVAAIFPAEADGTNLNGTVILPNPTVVSFELGNVTLNMLIGNIIIGQGRLKNVVLVPGNNTVPIRATFDIKAAIKNLPAILASEWKSLTNGNVMISASGNSTICNGLHIPYYEAILNNLVLTGEVPLVKILVGTLQNALGGNNTLITGILGALNNTELLTQLLQGLNGKNSTLTSLLTDLKV